MRLRRKTRIARGSWVVGVAGLSMFGLVGCATSPAPPKSRCAENTASPTSPGILERLPVLREHRDFEDPSSDFLRDHPIFEENFDAAGAFEQTRIPAVLDLRTIRVGPEGGTVLFQIGVAAREEGAATLRDLLTRRRAQIGVYIDTDRNGVSDFLITTTAEPELGMVIRRDITARVADVNVRISESGMALSVPKAIVGDRFDWIVFTGFTPIDGAYFPTSLTTLFFLPVVDVYYPQDVPANIGFSTLYVGTGKQCVVTETGFNSCPAQGNPAPVQVPTTSYQGVLIYDVRCDGRGYALWCIQQSFFGKRVYDPAKQGWIAKCPYKCGFNEEARWDQDSDGLVDKIFHTVTDQDCGSYHDGDGDGFLDVMTHTYLYATNQVTSCNLNRNYQTSALVSKNCKPPQTPYVDPAQVPGALP